jgi:legumain
MKIIAILLLCLLSLSLERVNFFGNFINLDENHWAVLVAGSNGFWNYRHQSDIFHAYHILLGNGIPRENIIVLAYDDIANDYENPFPGKIFNKPDPTGEGVNVYDGVIIDYKGSDVTPENFLAILEGDESKLKGKGTERVLKSSETDNVFIYFSDHGATGLVAFPYSELYADQLINTLKKMHEKKTYNKLVFYLEACESGSMFNNILPNNLNIYTTTASNPYQSSWAIYCSPDDRINNQSIGTCLGDEYSVNWMEDSDNHTKDNESLQIQYQSIKERTKNSEVHQYGSLDFVSENIWDFQGKRDTQRISKITRKIEKYMDYMTKSVMGFFGYKTQKEQLEENYDSEYFEYLEEAKNSKVDSREAKLFYLYQKVQKTNDKESYKELLKELEHIRLSDSIFSTFNQEFDVADKPIVEKIDFECLRAGVESYKTICKNWGEYDLIYVRNIAAACEKNVSKEKLEETFRTIC